MADPHNDQLAARARDDFLAHVGSAYQLLNDAVDEGEDDVEALAVVAQTLIDAEVEMPRSRLASLLAVGLIREAKRWRGDDVA